LAQVFLATAVQALEPLQTGVDFCTNGGSWLNPCPEPGQDCYGQDGSYRMGQARSYTKLTDGGIELPDWSEEWSMVRDNATGLVWEMKNPANQNNSYTWDDAKKYCEDLVHGHYEDWRLPTVEEISTLVDAGVAYPGPAVDAAYFPYMIGGIGGYGYWTSKSVLMLEDRAWAIRFSDGILNCDDINLFDLVVAVRGDRIKPSAFHDNGDGTVTDTVTGLMWQKESLRKGNKEAFSWGDALDACENLSLAGYADWRLPNKNELQTLAEYYWLFPAINTDYFPDTASQYYWSSTPSASDAWGAWGVHFGRGHVSYHGWFDFDVRVRAVRGGKSMSGDETPPASGVKECGGDHGCFINAISTF
jgi:hypothetical protein